MAKVKKAAAGARKRRVRKNIARGVAHIHSCLLYTSDRRN